jgi:opacity protein-like surface antigen
MKHLKLAAVLLGTLFASVALAEEAEPARPAAQNWSVGLGLGYSSLPTDALDLVLFNGQPVQTFTASSLLSLMTFTAERRVAPSTWLTAALQAGYVGGSSGNFSSSSKYVAVGVGGRQVFNPGDLVEVSGFATLGLTDLQSGPTTVGIKLGPCVEYPFNEHLRLRFSATVLGASYLKQGDASQTNLLLTLQPNLALQMAF